MCVYYGVGQGMHMQNVFLDFQSYFLALAFPSVPLGSMHCADGLISNGLLHQ